MTAHKALLPVPPSSSHTGPVGHPVYWWWLKESTRGWRWVRKAGSSQVGIPKLTLPPGEEEGQVQKPGEKGERVPS